MHSSLIVWCFFNSSLMCFIRKLCHFPVRSAPSGHSLSFLLSFSHCSLSLWINSTLHHHCFAPILSLVRAPPRPLRIQLSDCCFMMLSCQLMTDSLSHHTAQRACRLTLSLSLLFLCSLSGWKCIPVLLCSPPRWSPPSNPLSSSPWPALESSLSHSSTARITV